MDTFKSASVPAVWHWCGLNVPNIDVVLERCIGPESGERKRNICTGNPGPAFAGRRFNISAIAAIRTTTRFNGMPSEAVGLMAAFKA